MTELTLQEVLSGWAAGFYSHGEIATQIINAVGHEPAMSRAELDLKLGHLAERVWHRVQGAPTTDEEWAEFRFVFSVCGGPAETEEGMAAIQARERARYRRGVEALRGMR